MRYRPEKNNPNTPLTKRQRKLLQFVLSFTCEHGFQPTFRMIRAHMKIRSANAVYCFLKPLADKGYVAAKVRGDGKRNHAIKILRLPDGSPFRGLTIAKDGTDATPG